MQRRGAPGRLAADSIGPGWPGRYQFRLPQTGISYDISKGSAETAVSRDPVMESLRKACRYADGCATAYGSEVVSSSRLLSGMAEAMP